MVRVEPVGYFRWIIVILLCLGVMVSYIDRTFLPYAIQPIETLFNLKDVQFGVILAAFGFGYAISCFVGGILTDFTGSRLALGLSLFAWSAVMVGSGWVVGPRSLLVSRFLLGLTEGVVFSAFIRAIGNWVPRGRRSATIGVALICVPLSILIGGPMVEGMLNLWGWRTSFIVLGVLGWIVTIFWSWLARDYPRESPMVSDEELRYIHGGKEVDRRISGKRLRQEEYRRFTVHGSVLPRIFSNRPLWANFYASLVFGALLFFGVMWLPGYLEQTYKLSSTAQTLWLMFPWFIALFATPICGWLSDRLYARSHSYYRSRAWIIGWGMAVSALFFLIAGFTGATTVTLICVGLALAACISPNAPMIVLNLDLVEDRAGTATGIWNVFFSIGGMLGPFITGLIATRWGRFDGVFIFLGILALTSVIVLALFAPRREEKA